MLENINPVTFSAIPANFVAFYDLSNYANYTSAKFKNEFS
jgi:hypothetical protein